MSDSMEKETLRQSLAGFDQVWRRVQAGASFSSPKTLEALLEQVSLLARQYAALARRAAKSEQRGLWSCAQDYQVQSGRLQGEYFILTGQTHAIPQSPPLPSERKTALRQLLRQEQTLTQTSQAAAKQAGDDPMAALLQTLSDTAAAHVRQDHALLLRWFGG